VRTVDDLRARCQASWHLVADVVRDIASWPVRGPRLVDEMECVVSVLLAIVFAHLAGAKNVGWAAFSGYMVMRSHVSESFRRGVLRIVGTAIGAALAWLNAGLLASMAWLSLALGVVGAVTLYFALIRQRSYAWLLMGVTYVMVLADGMEHPGESLVTFARTRFIEVLIGTAACVLVSAVSTVTIRRYALPAAGQGARAPTPAGLWWHRDAMTQAVQAGVALALLPTAWVWLHLGALSQAGVTIMAVMLVPLSSLTAGANATTRKLVHRFAGCLLGGLLASGVLLAGHQLPVVMALGICVGVIVGRHIENGGSEIGYIGTQFVLVVLVVLVPDSYTHLNPQAALTRLVGILFGMVLLEPVRWVFRAVGWGARAAAAE